MANEGIYTAIIIDTRISDLYELVLNNFYSNLDKRWKFMIFCSNNNKNFIVNLINTTFQNEKYRTSIVILDINQPITVEPNNKGFVDYDYNKLLTDIHLYYLIPTEMFLIFQLDTLLSDIYHDNIYNFMNYDYVGAPWSFSLKGGNGGLSLRRKSKMIEIINDKNYIYNNPNLFYHEDGYFCKYPNINIPLGDLAKTFSVETCHYSKPAGIHQSFKYSAPQQFKELESHIPKLKELEIKYLELNKNTPIISINPDKSYKTDFFKNYTIINF